MTAVRRASRRSMPRRTAAAALTVMLHGGAAVAIAPLTAPPAPYRAPYLPASEDDVLQEVPSSSEPAVRKMQTLRRAFSAEPHSLAAAEDLAQAYIAYGRQVGDAHYAGYAEAVIAPWISATVPPAPVLVIQATILQYRHQFSDARIVLQQTFRSNPRNAQAWLILATLDMVQGDYAAAAGDCAQVANNVDVETGLACFGSLRGFTGKSREGLQMLLQAERSAPRASADYGAWIEGLIAENEERLGDWPAAEAHYREALKLQPKDNFLLVAFADFLLDRGRPGEVIPLLAEHTQSDTAFLRIALAESQLHSEQLQRYVWIMGARFEALRLRGSEFFGREESRFALRLQHDPQSALAMALRNWQVQRAPWDARVVLEAALAAREPRAAAPVLEFLEESRLEDPVIARLAQALRAQLRPDAHP